MFLSSRTSFGVHSPESDHVRAVVEQLIDVRRYLNQHRRLRHLLAGLQVDVNHEDREDGNDNDSVVRATG